MEKRQKRISLLIPTYNAGGRWITVLEAIARQTQPFYKKIIVDSGSSDETVAQAIAHGFEAHSIPAIEFNHGATRQLLAEKANGSDILVYLTQDAIPADNFAIANLIVPFADPEVAITYGRQLPHNGAKTLETHARLFNYPAISHTRSIKDKEAIGFKVFFCSNSFAAYRSNTLHNSGGFPEKSIMGEDAIVAARLLLGQYKLAYVAEAAVYHSHSYTFIQELKRYFDTRVFHEQNRWLIDEYGEPGGEGIRYVKSELSYVARNNPFALVKSISSILAKWLGYKLGGFYRKIPIFFLRKISMHATYWTSKKQLAD